MSNGDHKTSTMTPTTSTVVGGSVGLSLSVILVWAVRQFAEIEIPGEVAAAIGSVLSAGIVYLFPDGRKSTP